MTDRKSEAQSQTSITNNQPAKPHESVSASNVNRKLVRNVRPKSFHNSRRPCGFRNLGQTRQRFICIVNHQTSHLNSRGDIGQTTASFRASRSRNVNFDRTSHSFNSFSVAISQKKNPSFPRKSNTFFHMQGIEHHEPFRSRRIFQRQQPAQVRIIFLIRGNPKTIAVNIKQLIPNIILSIFFSFFLSGN